MINARVRLLAMVMAIVVGSSITLFLRRNTHSALEKSKKIALLVPALHPAMDEIVMGFKEKLHEKAPTVTIDFVEYNANGNKTLLNAQTQEIVAADYDAVFTIGVGASETMHTAIKKRASNLPLIFTAVGDPVAHGLVASLTQPNTNATGVIETIEYEQQIAALRKVKPTVKHILLVYDPTHPTNNHDKAQFQATAQKYGIAFDAVEIMHSNEISQKVAPFMNSTDVVLVLKDHVVVSGIDALITLCNRYNVTLYASDLNSADKGAALAFGVREYEYGSRAADVAYPIVIEGKNVAEIPVVQIEKQYLKVNKSAAKNQGLALLPYQIEQLQDDGIIILD